MFKVALFHSDRALAHHRITLATFPVLQEGQGSSSGGSLRTSPPHRDELSLLEPTLLILPVIAKFRDSDKLAHFREVPEQHLLRLFL